MWLVIVLQFLNLEHLKDKGYIAWPTYKKKNMDKNRRPHIILMYAYINFESYSKLP